MNANDYLGFARAIFPGSSDDYLLTLLWNCTAYPCAEASVIERQLLELKHNNMNGLSTCARFDPEIEISDIGIKK